MQSKVNMILQTFSTHYCENVYFLGHHISCCWFFPKKECLCWHLNSQIAKYMNMDISHKVTWMLGLLIFAIVKENMLTEVHDMAGQHEVIAENTQSQLIINIQKSVTEFKNDRTKSTELNAMWMLLVVHYYKLNICFVFYSSFYQKVQRFKVPWGNP